MLLPMKVKSAVHERTRSPRDSARPRMAAGATRPSAAARSRKDCPMPRDIPVGNGHFLVTFDGRYQIRDIYFPHVGQENHAGAGPCRFGVYLDVPAKNRGQL